MIIRDHDFHPDEPTVRVFRVNRDDVPRLDDDGFVSRARFGNVVLHHYAWADRWLKVNVTTDLDGTLTETAPTPDSQAFAFNIDIATPMVSAGGAVFAVDLFCDVLVRSDSSSYVVGDEDELEQAVRSRLISGREYRGARRELGELIDLIETGQLLELVNESFQLGPCAPAAAMPIERVPITEVPELAPGERRSW